MKQAGVREQERRGAAEERYQMLFRTMLDGFALHEIILDDDGRACDYRFLEVNPAFEELTGLKADDIVGRTALEVLPGLESFWVQTYGRVALTGEPARFDHYAARLDRHYRVYAFRPLPGRFACVFSDVTELKRAQAELEQHRDHLDELVKRRSAELAASEAKYRNLVERASDGILIIQDGRVRFLNRRCAELLGYEQAALADAPYDQLLPPDRALVMLERYRRRMAGEAVPTTYETELLCRDGSRVPVEVNAGLVEHDRRPADLLLVRDISRRRAAEEKSQASERRYERMAENLPRGAVHVLDRDLRYVYSAGEELTRVGRTWRDYAGRSVREVLSPGNAGLAERHLRRALAGERVRFEGRFGGREFIVSAVPLDGDPARPDTLLVLAVDITERRQAEAALGRVNEELARSNAELEQFASVASHDLKEPLRKVASFAELLAKRYRGQLDEKADSYIDYVVDGARRMQLLIDELLAWSRVGTRGRPPAPVELEAVFERVRDNLSTAIEESGATVVSTGLPRVSGDRDQLVQLLQNLVGNGIKFHGERPPEVTVSAAPAGDSWQVSVRDNGIGIPPEYHDKVFDLFQRLHGRGEYPGTGLGLAICRRIVERHGGRLWVESEPGQGSVFRFTLPGAGTAEGPATGDSEQTGAAMSRKGDK
ncbi:PAS domain S-box protein [candidate division WOR-3 bacterium]|nr:PAS domain S-box protein [candidate division WOR-3 bacterium]